LYVPSARTGFTDKSSIPFIIEIVSIAIDFFLFEIREMAFGTALNIEFIDDAIGTINWNSSVKRYLRSTFAPAKRGVSGAVCGMILQLGLKNIINGVL
jgi:hypothetical protein